MKPRDRAGIEKAANAGDPSAKDYLALLAACERVLGNTDGIALARGMIGEHEDVYGSAIDEALGVLMTAIVEAAKAQQGADVTDLNDLHWYLSPTQQAALHLPQSSQDEAADSLEIDPEAE